jgi:hypothetical protein
VYPGTFDGARVAVKQLDMTAFAGKEEVEVRWWGVGGMGMGSVLRCFGYRPPVSDLSVTGTATMLLLRAHSDRACTACVLLVGYLLLRPSH